MHKHVLTWMAIVRWILRTLFSLRKIMEFSTICRLHSFLMDAALGGEDVTTRRQVLRQVAALSKGMGQLNYGRAPEREAYKFAVDATYASGINPIGTATFFQKLVAMRDKEPGRLAKFFSTHPPSRERVENVRAQIGELPAKAGLASDSPRFREIKKRILERERVRRGKERRRR